ncbi:MAG: hypothetical protein AAF497_09370 [Planctomycetota bacterium]
MRLLQLMVAATLVVTMIGGCSQPTSTWDRIPLTGKVTVNDRSFSGGLSFIPTAGGPAAGTDSVNGSYRFNKQDGPIVGNYRVTLMPTSGSPLDGESLETVIDVPKQPPFELDLKFQLADGRQLPEGDISTGNVGNLATGNGYGGTGAAASGPGGQGNVGYAAGAKPGSKPRVAEEEEKKPVKGDDEVPTRGPAGSN